MALITVEAKRFFEPRLFQLQQAIASGRIGEGMEMVLVPAKIRNGGGKIKTRFYPKDRFGNPLAFDFLEFPDIDCSAGSLAFYTIAAIKRMVANGEVTVDMPFRPISFKVAGEDRGVVDIFCADNSNEPLMLLDFVRGRLTLGDYPVKIRRDHPCRSLADLALNGE